MAAADELARLARGRHRQPGWVHRRPELGAPQRAPQWRPSRTGSGGGTRSGDGRTVGAPLGPRGDAASVVARDVRHRRGNRGCGGKLMELLPAKATFAPGEPMKVELRGSVSPTRIALFRLSRKVADVEVPAGQRVVTFPPQPEGGYGVEADGARTALDVLADPLARARYGFVSQ